MKHTLSSELFARRVDAFSIQFQIGTRVYECSVRDAVSFARLILEVAGKPEIEEPVPNFEEFSSRKKNPRQ